MSLTQNLSQIHSGTRSSTHPGPTQVPARSVQTIHPIQSGDINSYVLEPVSATSARFTLSGVRTVEANSGATEIRLVGCPEYCMDADIRSTPGLPAHADTSECSLSILNDRGLLTSCED